MKFAKTSMPLDIQGGKKKPIKQKKKERLDEDETDVEFKKKQVADKKALEAARKAALGKKK